MAGFRVSREPPVLAHKNQTAARSELERITAFVESLPITHGRRSGETVRLLPYQRDLLREWFGGRARLRIGVFSAGRGAGKSWFTSAVMLALLFGLGNDARRGREIYLLSKTEFQSAQNWERLCAICEEVPEIGLEVITRREPPQIQHPSSRSRLVVQPCRPETLRGAAVTAALLDECAVLDESKGNGNTRRLLETLSTGAAKQDPPGRLFAASTASNAPDNVFEELCQQAASPDYPKVRGRVFRGGHDVDLTDADSLRAALLRANPHAGALIDIDELVERGLAAAARGDASAAEFRAHALNEPLPPLETQPWLDPTIWRPMVDRVPIERGGNLYVGCHLDSRLASLALYWPTVRRLEIVSGVVGSEANAVEEHQRRSVPALIRSGALTPHEGALTPAWALATLGRHLRETLGSRPAAIAVDSWRHEEWRVALAGERRAPDLVKAAGTASEHAALDEFERLVRTADLTLAGPGVPLLTSSALRAVIQSNPRGQRSVDERKSGSTETLRSALYSILASQRRAQRPRRRPVRMMLAGVQ